MRHVQRLHVASFGTSDKGPAHGVFVLLPGLGIRKQPSPTSSEELGDQMFEQGDWRVRAACRDENPDQLFVRGAEQRKARMICYSCPVRTECLGEALDHRIEFGVWGGMTERERRALLRRRPDVQNWRELLEAARKDYSDDFEHYKVG